MEFVGVNGRAFGERERQRQQFFQVSEWAADSEAAEQNPEAARREWKQEREE